MTAEWLHRWLDAPMAYQEWRPFPDHAIVQVRNFYGEARVGPAGSFWWGYEREMGRIAESVIIWVRRLDKPKGGDHE